MSTRSINKVTVELGSIEVENITDYDTGNSSVGSESQQSSTNPDKQHTVPGRTDYNEFSFTTIVTTESDELFNKIEETKQGQESARFENMAIVAKDSEDEEVERQSYYNGFISSADLNDCNADNPGYTELSVEVAYEESEGDT